MNSEEERDENLVRQNEPEKQQILERTETPEAQTFLRRSKRVRKPIQRLNL